MIIFACNFKKLIKICSMQLYSYFEKHPIITTDSRNCPEGSMFFALKGDKFNANAFAAQAIANGCAYAVVDEEEYALDEHYILVDNVLESLQALARYHRTLLATPIIGITGSNGKTTSKELIASVLMQDYNVHFTKGNYNNHIGVPLTLLQMQEDHQIAIIEMGANHLGEIKILCDIALPNYGIITNVGKAHLEGFGSFEGVMKTKGELYDSIAKTGKLIFMNHDNHFLQDMAAKAGLDHRQILSFSMGVDNKQSIVYGKIIASQPLLSMQVRLFNGEEFEVNTQLVGNYNAENVLAAVTIGSYYGMNAETIKRGIESYVPQNNRSQLTQTANNKLVVDAYNANPTSMAAAIENFALLADNNKVLILGDMLEMGNESLNEHQKIIDLVASFDFELVYIVGTEFAATNFSVDKGHFRHFANVQDLQNFLADNKHTKKTILIKGSRGIQLEKCIEML